MLRMLGIPARVVSGFAPGARDAESGAYEVRDFDAHSWVEVYFRGIGWVTFDPTPGVAPAERPTLGGDADTALAGPTPGVSVPDSTGGFRRGDQEQGASAPLNQGISAGKSASSVRASRMRASDVCRCWFKVPGTVKNL